MNNNSIGQYVLTSLQKNYRVTERELGKDAFLDKNLMHFHIRSFDVEGLGHFCLFDMKGMLGAMKMETVVLADWHHDVPLLNLDYIKVFSNKTQLAELYDTMIASKCEELQSACQKIKDSDSDLPAYLSGEHWYDSILLPCSYGKKVKARETRTDSSCMKYVDEFLAYLDKADKCDPAAKKANIRKFVQGLLDNGGPAVNQVRKMFGEEITQRLILDYMYGVGK